MSYRLVLCALSGLLSGVLAVASAGAKEAGPGSTPPPDAPPSKMERIMQIHRRAAVLYVEAQTASDAQKKIFDEEAQRLIEELAALGFEPAVQAQRGATRSSSSRGSSGRAAASLQQEALRPSAQLLEPRGGQRFDGDVTVRVQRFGTPRSLAFQVERRVRGRWESVATRGTNLADAARAPVALPRRLFGDADRGRICVVEGSGCGPWVEFELATRATGRSRAGSSSSPDRDGRTGDGSTRDRGGQTRDDGARVRGP